MNPDPIGSAVHMTEFDATYDVVVVGFGYAGGITAIEAAKAGAEVLLLEKEPVPGGISICSGGAVRCAEDADDAFEYLKATNGGRIPDEIVKVNAQGMTQLEDYVRTLAENVNATVVTSTGPDKAGNYPFPGRKTFYYTQVASLSGFDPAEVYPHVNGKESFKGRHLFRVIEKNLATQDVTVALDQRVVRLVSDRERSEARGVVVETETGERTVQARKGVVLASGGFERDTHLKEQYFENKPVLPIAGKNEGDGHKLAMDLGADLWHMWHFHGSYGFRHPNPEYPYAIRLKRFPDWVPKVPSSMVSESPASVEAAGGDQKAVPMSWILLDQNGERYMNEYPPYLQDTGQRPMSMFDPTKMDFPRNPSYLICDDSGRRRYPLGDPITNDPNVEYKWSDDNLKEVENGILQRSETIAGLARELDLPPTTVEQSIDRWNEFCEQNKDEEYGRPSNSMLPITEPPFYGAEVWSVVSNTQGGPAHDTDQRIVKATGESIDRLYAAGEIGSAYGHLYLAGANIAECFIAGRVAGHNTTTLNPWDEDSSP